MTRVVAFNGSARKDGNTAILLNFVLDELKKEDVETELIQLAGETLSGCIACYRCRKNKDQKCAVMESVRSLPPVNPHAKATAWINNQVSCWQTRISPK